jgi:hypothetical protein
LKHTFLNSIYESKVEWKRIAPEIGIRITERYSHCACYYDKSLYDLPLKQKGSEKDAHLVSVLLWK